MRRWRTLPLWALGTSLVVFLVGSFLPEWSFWRSTGFSKVSSVEVDANLWQAMDEPSAEWQFQDGNTFCTASLLMVSVGVGLLVYWIGMGRRRPVEAADYKDAPGGAVPDGRIDPKRT